jgi:hypothetical protein
MYWGDAKKACESLGDGWRMPTKDELNILYQNKDKIGGFDSRGGISYWSSVTTGYSNFYAFTQSFYDGNQSFSNREYTYYVRAVKSL